MTAKRAGDWLNVGPDREHLPSPEYFCGRRLPAAEGLTQIATSYAIAFDSQVNASSIISGRHAMARLFIEQHLRDPELTPCLIALRLKLSSRYLRMIFATGSETVSTRSFRDRYGQSPRHYRHGRPAIAC